MSEMFTTAGLSFHAIEMLGQLYAFGPTWDGNVVSKMGRGELVRAGLALHHHGYAFLTSEGVRTAVEWNIADLKKGNHHHWLAKRRKS